MNFDFFTKEFQGSMCVCFFFSSPNRSNVGRFLSTTKKARENMLPTVANLLYKIL